jgi:hypothetical protein
LFITETPILIERKRFPMAIQPQMTPPSSSPRRSRRARLGNLNMGIAKTHRIATQFVGMQLSGANLLALTVSAASVVAGTLSLVAERYPYNWPLFISAGVIGLGLALLIEGLTLGSLIRIRLANRAIRGLEETIDNEMREALAELKVPDPAQANARQAMRSYRQTIRFMQQEYRRKRQHATNQQRKQRRFSFPLAAMGAISSAIAGGLFYHTILAGLGPLESLVLAILFPLVVTGTFVSSEIHKEAQEDAIREGFGGGALTETAIREETKLHSALAVHQKVMAYLEKPEAEQAMEEGAKYLLSDILAELRESSRQVTQRMLITEEKTDNTTRQLALTKQAGDTTPSGSKQAGDTTQQSSFVASVVQEMPDTSQNTAQEDHQEHTVRPVPEKHQRREDDTTSVPVIPQKNYEEKRQDDTVVQNHAVLHDMPGDQKRQNSRPLSQERASEATSEHDTLTTQILAYLASHDNAKQRDVAQTLGITVRTVQRKLTAHKRQQS